MLPFFINKVTQKNLVPVRYMLSFTFVGGKAEHSGETGHCEPLGGAVDHEHCLKNEGGKLMRCA